MHRCHRWLAASRQRRSAARGPVGQAAGTSSRIHRAACLTAGARCRHKPPGVLAMLITNGRTSAFHQFGIFTRTRHWIALSAAIYRAPPVHDFALPGIRKDILRCSSGVLLPAIDVGRLAVSAARCGYQEAVMPGVHVASVTPGRQWGCVLRYGMRRRTSDVPAACPPRGVAMPSGGRQKAGQPISD
jgi:hypothetical protein